MPDLSFPLRYSDRGGIETVEDSQLTQARHLVRTIAGERVLFQNFGVPLDLLLATKVPEIVAERVRLAVAQLASDNVDVQITNLSSTKIRVTVIVGADQLVLDLDNF